jgi:hypothetical protein
MRKKQNNKNSKMQMMPPNGKNNIRYNNIMNNSNTNSNPTNYNNQSSYVSMKDLKIELNMINNYLVIMTNQQNVTMMQLELQLEKITNKIQELQGSINTKKDKFNPQSFNPQTYNPQTFNPQTNNPFNPQTNNPRAFNPQYINPYNPQTFNPQTNNPFNPQTNNQQSVNQMHIPASNITNDTKYLNKQFNIILENQHELIKHQTKVFKNNNNNIKNINNQKRSRRDRNKSRKKNKNGDKYNTKYCNDNGDNEDDDDNKKKNKINNITHIIPIFDLQSNDSDEDKIKSNSAGCSMKIKINDSQNEKSPFHNSIITKKTNKGEDGIGDLFDVLNNIFTMKTGEDTESTEDSEEYEVPNYTSDDEFENLELKINSIDDIITLSDKYTELVKSQKDIILKSKNKVNNEKKNNGYYELNNKKYAINLKTIVELKEPLIKLKEMVGLEKIKESILDMILYYLQNFENKNKNMLHTVIEGAPGVGKTELGKIIGEIYNKLGVIPSNKFKIVRRTDLIGKYVGHTAHKTQKVIDEANGGVLFIDEAYSLGSGGGENGDTFSKECIDTINQNLSEKKNKLICIIAGYADELEKCFFSQNPGLKRRFPFKYTIEGYSAKELKDIFIKKINDSKWNIDKQFQEKDILHFFETNKEKFVHFGGDIENLIVSCKFCHSRRVINQHPKLRRIFTKEDIINGLERFIKNKKEKDTSFMKDLYI